VSVEGVSRYGTSGSGDSFVVDLNGVKLSAVAIAFPRNGGTQGIWIYDRELLESRLPDLQKTLEQLGREQ
jgi:hypothetical protein